MNGTLVSSGGRSVLRFERSLPHGPEKVWRAITEAQELAGWFPARIEGERKVGAPLRFVDEGGETFGEVLECEEPRLFSFSWGDSVLRFELQAEAAGCLLIFTHTFDERPFAASFATGWHKCLDGLGGVLEGRPAVMPGQAETAGTRWYRARHEAYVEIFGLLRGNVADGAVRFERLLPYPRDRVWEVLTGGEAVVVGEQVPAPSCSAASPAGHLIEVAEPETLAYESASGAVRWKLVPGPGGTLITLTHSTADSAEALVAWHRRIESLADELTGLALGGTPESALHELYDSRSE